MKLRNVLHLIGYIILSEFAGVVGTIFTTPAIRSGWYAALAKPEWAPPNAVFAPVWTTLFALMGISLWLVQANHSKILPPSLTSFVKTSEVKKLRRAGKNIGMRTIGWWARTAFFIQLALNVLWSAIFFGLRSPGGALIEILILWVAILGTILIFARISKHAAWLMTPYILWVTFAGHLNYSIWMLNR